MKIILCLSIVILLSGCGGTRTIVSKTEESPRLQLNLSDQPPLSLVPVEWVIITKENAEDIFARLEKEGKVSLFSLTDDGYKALSLNMAKIVRYIMIDKDIIKKYKSYYEGPKIPSEN